MRISQTSIAVVLALAAAALATVAAAADRPRWRNTGGGWPASSNQVRALTVREGLLYAGTGGSAPFHAQVWKLSDRGWVKHAQFEQFKVAVLQSDAADNLYVGMGTPHSAERRGAGRAEVRKFDAGGRQTLLKKFTDKDVVYSMTWHGGKLHLGTLAEDLPGSAEIWRFDDPGWTQVAGGSINGWPAGNTYAGVYEMWVHDGELSAGTFSRKMGDGDVLKLTRSGWVNLEAPKSLIALSFATYQGKLTVAFSNFKAGHRNPIFAWEADGTWRPLGTAPTEWKDAYIPNHLLTEGRDLYLGVGGTRGTISVWKYDGTSWSKIAGDGLNGSWKDPLVAAGSEWVYRMQFHKGKLYVGLAADRKPLAQIWEMTP